MLCGVPVADVVDRIGSKKTTIAKLRWAASLFGYAIGKCCSSMPIPPFPPPYLVLLQSVIDHKLCSHWVVYDGTQFVCPDGPPMKQLPGYYTAKFYRVLCSDNNPDTHAAKPRN
jgi:hypothetical protein